MKRLALFIFITFLCNQFIVAQGDIEINVDDKTKIYSYAKTHLKPLILTDYDNKDNLWISFFGGYNDSIYTFHLDDNFNVLKKITNNRREHINFKFNDKYYGLRHSYYSNTNYIDSIFFYCSDSTGHNLITKLIRTDQDDDYKFLTDFVTAFFSGEKEIVILNYSDVLFSPQRTSHITVIDTLGNVLNSKAYEWEPHNYSFAITGMVEYDDVYGLIRKSILLEEDFDLFYIDKQTLNIVDSAKFDKDFLPLNIFRINDSIYASGSDEEVYFDGKIYRIINIININSLEVIQTKIHLDVNEDFSELYIPEFGRRLDFANPDSIYFCYFVYNKAKGTNHIEISNFNINGDINFRYKIDYSPYELFKQINGIKATQDGGVVIVCALASSCWVIRFNPTGLVNLTNVETGERESIRVYPNPAKDYIEVDIEAERFSSSEIELFDMQGRMVKKAKLAGKKGNRIDVSSLPSGVYVLGAKNDDGVMRKKIIKN